MGVCRTCGNDYDKTFEIKMRGESYEFDCFECAIQQLAPVCANCHVHILGHGIEADGEYFCCASCAEHSGVVGVKDRA